MKSMSSITRSVSDHRGASTPKMSASLTPTTCVAGSHS